MKLAKYRKALVAVLAVVLTGLNIVYGNNEAVQMAIMVATAFGVYQVPNAKK